jgi:hypothetical protein
MGSERAKGVRTHENLRTATGPRVAVVEFQMHDGRKFLGLRIETANGKYSLSARLELAEAERIYAALGKGIGRIHRSTQPARAEASDSQPSHPGEIK